MASTALSKDGISEPLKPKTLDTSIDSKQKSSVVTDAPSKASVARNVTGHHRVKFIDDGPNSQKNIILFPGHFEEYDPFLMMAEDWMRTPAGYPDHPHRGFETVTLLLSGACEHGDSNGNSGVLYEGDVQWMTAGKGIIHSEMPHGEDMCHLLQLWLNLPKKHKMVPSRYQDLRKADISVRRAGFWLGSGEAGGASVRVVSGQSGEVTAATKTYVDIKLLEIRLEPGAAFTEYFPANHNSFLYILQGQGLFGGVSKDFELYSQKSKLSDQCESASPAICAEPLLGSPKSISAGAGEVLLMAPSGSSTKDNSLTHLTISNPIGATADSDKVTSGSKDTSLWLVLMSGEPLREPVAHHGPFVMNTQAELRQAFTDYQSGRFTNKK